MMFFCGRIKRERDAAIRDRDAVAQRAAMLTKNLHDTKLERDAALNRVKALEKIVRDATPTETMTAKHQGLKHNKHRYQVFDDAGKIIAQQPMNRYRSKGDALADLRRLIGAKIVVEGEEG